MAVGAIKEPGRHAVGKNLYLQVGKTGSRSWLMKFMLRGKAREMGLGAYDVVSLKDAREKVFEAKRLIDQGIDPIEHRKQDHAQLKAQKQRSKSFKDVAEHYMSIHVPQNKNAKHRAQWPSTLERYVYPMMGDKAISEIDLGDVKKVLDPIWSTKPPTADRVRGRMEAILDFAAHEELRDRDNPAEWKGNLEFNYPPKSKVKPPKKHRSLPYQQAPDFWQRLIKHPNISARCLEFLILTATRSSEARLATWDEIDLGTKIWAIPEHRMKAGKGHRVPLSNSAVKLLEELKPFTEGGLIFPGNRQGKPLSENTKTQMLKSMKVNSTAHGFRSTFRTWAEEQTQHTFGVMEAALAHSVGSATVQSYQRGDLFDKRAELMQEWDDYLHSKPGNIELDSST